MNACAAKAPSGCCAGPPHYPDFVFPALTPPDPRLADLASRTRRAGSFFRLATSVRAERDFQAVLKKSAAFYPSEAALGYLELSRKNYPQALIISTAC